MSLLLAEGQTLVVFGPNGAGKTTLLRVLATLLRPHSGDGACARQEPARTRHGRCAGAVGLLGHEPLLSASWTARENLRYHARLHGVGEDRVEGDTCGSGRSTDRADEPLKTLSRGMVQRVAICRAVLHDPELLLLDEPRANLDPAAIELVDPLIGAGSDPGGRTHAGDLQPRPRRRPRRG